MAITVAQRRPNEFASAFSQTFNPFLQLLLAQRLKEKTDRPTEERAERKELRETQADIGAGKIDIRSIPESIRKQITLPPSLDTAGLKGDTQALQDLVGGGAEVRGIPEFLQRFNPPEAPQVAQERLRTGFAEQQQAINPFRTISSIKADIQDKAIRLGVDALDDAEKVIGGFVAKESASDKIKLLIADKLIEIANPGGQSPRGSKKTQTKIPPDILKEFPDAFEENGEFFVTKNGKKQRIKRVK